MEPNTELILQLIKSHAETTDAKLAGIATDVSEIKAHMLSQNGRIGKMERKNAVLAFAVVGVGGTVGVGAVTAFFHFLPYVITGLLAAAR